MKVRNLLRLSAAIITSVSSLLTLTVAPVHAAGPYTCTWQSDSYLHSDFSDPAAWSGCNSGAPQPGDGDNLVFPNNLENRFINNDLNNATFGSITFTGSSGSHGHGYAILGNPFTLTGGIYDNSVSVDRENFTFNEVDPQITFTGNQTVNISSEFTDLFLLNGIRGSGNVTKTGIGSLELDGDTRGWSGQFTASAGTVIADNQYVLGDSSSNSVIINNTARFVVISCSGFNFAGNLTFNGASFTSSDGIAYPKLGASLGCWRSGLSVPDEYWGGKMYLDPQAVFSGTLILGNDITFAGLAGTVKLTGPLTGNHSITLIPGYGSKLIISSSQNGSGTPNGTYTPGQVTQTLGNSSASSLDVYPNNAVVVDGTRGDTTVWPSGILQGTGTVGQLDVKSGATVAPGHSPGCLNSGDLTLAGSFEAQIGGTTVCSGYDQLKVTGTVDITGSILKPGLYGGFVPSVGQSFTIVDNDGSDAILGTFNSVAEGGAVTADGVTYTVSYKGSDGNDIVLTVKSIDTTQLPKAPNTGLMLIAGNTWYTLATTALATFILVVIAGKLQAIKRR